MKSIIYSRTTLAICFLLCFTTLNAQVATEKHIEFETGEGWFNYRVETFKNKGMLLLSQQEKSANWKVEAYSDDLVKGEDKTLTLPKGYYMRAEYTSDFDENLLFSNKQSQFVFYQIDPNTLELTKSTGVLPKKMNINWMVAQGDLAFVGLQNKKGPTLLKINIKDNKTTLIPINISPYDLNDLSIEKIQILEGTGQVFVYINAYNKKDHNMYVLQIDESGEKEAMYNLSATTDKKISSVSASPLGDGEYIFTGTYSSKSSASSEGMYIASANAGDIRFMKFYNFTDFQDFFSYLPKKKQEKIEKKKEKAEDKNKELSYNYYIAEHPIQKIGDVYMMVGEAYYPTYRTTTTTTYVNGKPTTTTTTVFDGYQYTHASVAAFSMDGDKLWDKTFTMYPSYKPFSVKRFISINTTNDKIDLLFASENSIRSFSVDVEGNVANERSVNLITETDDEEKVKRSSSNLTHWFDNYFIASGYQTIKNSDEKIGNKKRSIFFINKITYE